jgi:cytochrome c-type biogenesis protein CcmF
MVIHPVMLYLGYVGVAVPFAFAVGALLSKRLDNEWVRTVRRWTLVPWMFLSLGIIMGSQWAYMELGWGGYWAWDPVENASPSCPG